MSANSLTAEEEKLYDRQLRVWGKEAQNRLRNSRVCLYQVNGLGLEIAKNLCLAGIGSLTIIDSHVVETRDLCVQFACSEQAVGQNRVAASQDKLKGLNPHVTVVAEETPLADLPDAFFNDFSVVCLCGATLAQQLRVDALCRARNIPFFAGQTLGHFAFFVADADKFTYAVKVPEKETEGNNNNNSSSSSSHKKAKTNNSIDVKTELKTCSFPAVVDVFGTSTELLSKVYGRRNKVSAQLLAFLLTALRFQDQHDRFPVTGAEADIAAMQSLSTQHGCSYDTAKFHPLLSSLACESSPVCAITGGMLTQEVMKAITAKSAPFKNVLLYNSKTGKALVKYVGPAEAKKVVKKQVVEDIILL